MHLKHYSFAVYEDFGEIFFILLQIVVLRDVKSRKIAFPGGQTKFLGLDFAQVRDLSRIAGRGTMS